MHHRGLFWICLFLFHYNTKNNIGGGVRAQSDSIEFSKQQRLPITNESTPISNITEDGIMNITDDKPKTSWPELVGVDGQDAKTELEEQEPDKKIILVPEGRMVTMDYRTDRIRLFLDGDGKVARTPIIG